MQKRKIYGRYVALFLSFLLIFSMLISCEMGSLIREDGSSEEGSESVSEKESGSVSENDEGSNSTADTGEDVVLPLFFHALTGEGCTEEQSKIRPLAFVIGNTNAGLPQNGLSLAEILIEAPIDAAETRLLMLTTRYAEAEKIGSIRAATRSLATLAESFRAVLVESGSADGSKGTLESCSSVLSADTEANGFYKESGRLNPHNIFTSGSRLQNAMASAGISAEKTGDAFFSFADEDRDGVLSWEVATHVKVTYSASQCTEFRYASGSGVYTRYLNGIAQTDEISGKTVTCKNVLILYCNSTVTETEDEVSLSLSLDSGSGVYATDGSYVSITWTRTENGALILKRTGGETISINRGTTHIQLVKSSQKASVVVDCN